MKATTYRYHTQGSAALQPEESRVYHRAHIINYEDVAPERMRVPQMTFAQKLVAKLKNDPLIGSISEANSEHFTLSKKDQRTFRLMVAATSLFALIVILVAA